MTYPAQLPSPPERTPEEPAHLYGPRLVAYLLRTDCLATVPDADLALAAHAIVALAPADYPDPVRARLSRLQHLIATVLRLRQPDPPAPEPIPMAAASAPPIGPGAPLAPVPTGRPPSGEYAPQDTIPF